MSCKEEPAHVLITGAAGQIGYIISTWIASGALYGERKIVLHLFDIPVAQKKLDALVMELKDCAFETLAGIIPTTDPEVAFKDIDCAFMVASVPMKKGMKRVDLLEANAIIFKNSGEWLSKWAKPTCKILVIGNPDNTNALITQMNCKNIPKENFHSLSQLDMNRAISEIATKLGVETTKVHGVYVWGNHADTMVADLTHATFERDGKEIPILSVIDKEYAENEFPDIIQKRGFVVMAARGNSSAASPTKAAIQHMKAWLFGTKEGEVLSMGIPVPENEYGIQSGINFSFPCTVDKNGVVHIVKGLKINDWLRERLKITENELLNEKEIAIQALKDKN